MSLISRIKSALFTEPAPPKAPTSQVSTPKYLGKARATTLTNTAQNTTSLDLSNFARSAGTLNQTIANLVKTSPDVSQALATKISSGIPENYTVLAYNEIGRVHEQGTRLAQAFALRLDTLSPDYTKFTRSTDLRSLSSSLLLDSLRYGAMAAELVLGKARVPALIKPIPTSALKWADAGDGQNSYPVYKGPSEDIHLNYPTIFYSATQQDAETPYADSPLQTAIQAAMHDLEFQAVLRRAAHKQLLQRIMVTINSEKWMQTLPLEVQSDATKLREHTLATIAQVETQMNALNPEDSLILFDTLSADTLGDSNRSDDRSVQVLNDIINGNVSSGAKILPSIIGRGQSSSAASTEAQLFVKAVAFQQAELNAMYSRIFTLAMRLMGQPVFVKFAYEDVNLRPELELASFKAVRQSGITELLSLGMVSDIEASIQLTGTLPPEGYKNLAGTMFKTATVDTKQNDYSNTSATADGKADGTQTDKNNTPDTPTGVPGKNPKK